MNYQGKKIAITGVSGFLGRAIADQLERLAQPAGENTLTLPGVYKYVKVLEGDVRDPKTFKALDHTFDYLFHFAAPSSQVLFKRQAAYCIESTLKGLMNAASACQKHGIRLIYPSTGLLSSDRYNEYALCKKISEDYVQGLGIDALGIRIFATYGPGEGHKADYASVPYLFARDLVNGKAPVIFGDGEQVRDFIYIDDVVNAVCILAEECHQPIIDVGSGAQTSFNAIVKELNLIVQSPRAAQFVDAPSGYVKETAADPTDLQRYYKPQVTFAQGLAMIVRELTGDTDKVLPTAKKKREKVAA
jgi:UDP-glucose 4-epimerase